MSNEKDYKFTQDWFGWAPPVWQSFVPMLPGRKNFLEIGSYEGRSTVWIAEHMAEDGATILAVDTWEGGEEHATVGEKMSVVEANFDHNLNVCHSHFPERKISKIKMTSYDAISYFAGRMGKECPVDFVYIDGSHIAKDVLADACMAWPLLKSGGIMVFDDYPWGGPRDILHRPKIAIDTFTNIYAEHLEIIAMGYQVAVRKK